MTFSAGIEFEFADSDSLLVELEELYSYAEVNDFSLNREAAKSLSESISHEIGTELFCRRALANLEILNYETRTQAVRSLLCVLQGGSHIEVQKETVESAEEKPSSQEQEFLDAELLNGIRYGCYGLVKLDAWNIFINLLLSESKQIKKEEDSTNLKLRQGKFFVMLFLTFIFQIFSFHTISVFNLLYAY